MKARGVLLTWAVISVGIPLTISIGYAFDLPYLPPQAHTAMYITIVRAFLLCVLAKKVFDHRPFAAFLNS